MTKLHMFFAEVGRPHSVWLVLDYSLYIDNAPLIFCTCYFVSLVLQDLV